MGVFGDELGNIAIETMISSFIAGLSGENKQLARDNADNITGFIEKFDDNMILLIYKSPDGKAQLVIADKKDIVSHKEQSEINISDIIDSAISQL